MEQSEQTEKAEVIRFLLNEEGRVMLCLDATHPDVDIPRRFQGNEGLRLILNNNMPQPIDIGSAAIESELRFGGTPHYCVIPYQALWGAFNPDTSHGMFWPDSMPESVRRNYHLSFSLVPKEGEEFPAGMPARAKPGVHQLPRRAVAAVPATTSNKRGPRSVATPTDHPEPPPPPAEAETAAKSKFKLIDGGKEEESSLETENKPEPAQPRSKPPNLRIIT